MDPRLYFPAIQAAYALPGAFPGITVVDTVLGMDWDGERPYGAIYEPLIGPPVLGFAGTRTGPEWAEDFDIVDTQTPYGHMSDGIWGTFKTLRTGSSVPLGHYANCKVGGHSRGGPLALAWAVMFSSPEYCVFNSPRLCGSDLLSKLTCPGAAIRIRGDLVSRLDPFYPAIPNDQEYSPPHSGDLVYCHEMSTVMASISSALQSTP